MPARKRPSTSKKKSPGGGVADSKSSATVKSELGEWIVWFACPLFLDGVFDNVLNQKSRGWQLEVEAVLHTEVSEKIADHKIREFWRMSTTGVLRSMGEMSRDDFLSQYGGARVWKWLGALKHQLSQKRNQWLGEEDQDVSDQIRERQAQAAKDARAARTPAQRGALSGAGTQRGEPLVRAHDHALTGVEHEADADGVGGVVAAANEVWLQAQECQSKKFLDHGLAEAYPKWDKDTTIPLLRAYIFRQKLMPFNDPENNPFAVLAGTVINQGKKAPPLPEKLTASMRQGLANMRKESAAASAAKTAAKASAAAKAAKKKLTAEAAAVQEEGEEEDGVEEAGGEEDGEEEARGTSTRRSQRKRVKKKPTATETIKDLLGDSSSEEVHVDEEFVPRAKRRRGGATDTPSSKSTHTPKSSGSKPRETAARANGFSQRLDDAKNATQRTLNVNHHPRNADEARLWNVQAVIAPLTLIRQRILEIQQHQQQYTRVNPAATPKKRKESLLLFAEEKGLEKAFVFVPRDVLRTNFSLAKNVYDKEKVSDAQLNGLKLVVGGMEEEADILTADTLTRLHACLQDVDEDDIGDWM